jgi:AcrR family transcriptional regulator
VSRPISDSSSAIPTFHKLACAPRIGGQSTLPQENGQFLFYYERAHFSLDSGSWRGVFYEHAHFWEPVDSMRITAEAKSATRQRILRAAASLFADEGWWNTTTRGIAQAAGIATGTLFNYFSSKEALAAEIVAEALGHAAEEFRAHRTEENSLEADLFSLIWSGLRSLSEFRKFLAPASETIFSPLARQSPDSPGEAIRVNHLELVTEIVAAHGFPANLPAVTMQLYWTLYLGVFAYWAADDSPGQEDTMALLDQSLKLFAASLGFGQERGTYGRQSQ